MLPTVVIEALRSGTPIVGAMVGPIVAREKGRQVSNVKQVAAYSFGGWLTGYVAQRALFWVLDNVGQSRLPTEVSSVSLPATPMAGISRPAPPPAPPEPPKAPPAPTPMPKASMDKAEVQNEGVRIVDTDSHVIPKNVKSHMADAYGSEL